MNTVEHNKLKRLTAEGRELGLRGLAAMSRLKARVSPTGIGVVEVEVSELREEIIDAWAERTITNWGSK